MFDIKINGNFIEIVDADGGILLNEARKSVKFSRKNISDDEFNVTFDKQVVTGLRGKSWEDFTLDGVAFPSLDDFRTWYGENTGNFSSGGGGSEPSPVPELTVENYPVIDTSQSQDIQNSNFYFVRALSGVGKINKCDLLLDTTQPLNLQGNQNARVRVQIYDTNSQILGRGNLLVNSSLNGAVKLTVNLEQTVTFTKSEHVFFGIGKNNSSQNQPQIRFKTAFKNTNDSNLVFRMNRNSEYLPSPLPTNRNNESRCIYQHFYFE